MTEQQSACCPPGSWGPLKADTDYKDKGVVERVADDIDIYRVGSSDKCIVWNYDIFGFQGGRTRQLCDMVAEQGTCPTRNDLPRYFHSATVFAY